MVPNKRTGEEYFEATFPEEVTPEEVKEEYSSSTFTISMTIVNALTTSNQLTLNEKIVMAGIAVSVALHVLKSKMCPKSWGQIED